MLTVQPNLLNNYKAQTFTRRYQEPEDVDYVEVYPSNRGFDIDYEKAQSKHELDLWEQTKHNLEDIAKTTEQVPVLNKGTKLMSGLISVAIGWGGLRWGTVGTLEVMSKIGKTKLAQSAKKFLGKYKGQFVEKFKNVKAWAKNSKLYKSAGEKFGALKASALETKAGKKYLDIKAVIKDNSIYQKAVNYKKQVVNYIKNLNPKRVFVETMGVAGGATAAVNTLGGKTIDGTRQIVETDDNGGYIIDGRRYQEDYRYAS